MKNFAVIGAGLMGTGITQTLIMADYTVYLIDIDNDKLGKAIHFIKTSLENAANRGLLKEDEIKKKVNAIKTSTRVEELPKDIDLVIETVSEDYDTKVAIFKKLETICSKKTIFATNTSSISISKLAENSARNDKFIGMHFFYPAERNKLLEITPTANTSRETCKTIMQLAEFIEKIAIITKDQAGLCVNRFFLPILNEAAMLLDTNQYHKEIYTINFAVKDAFKAPFGPFELMNLIGTSLTYQANLLLSNELGEFYRPCDLLKEQGENNTPWDLPEINKYKDMESAAFHDTPEIKKHFQGLVMGICAKLAEENVASITDINLGAKIGLGWKYGPFEMMNDFGPSKTAYLINEYANNNVYFPVVANMEDKEYWSIHATKYSSDNNISDIKLWSPDKMNAISESMLKELNKKIDSAITDESTDIITISGYPGIFSTGVDTNFLLTSLQRKKPENIINNAEFAQAVFNKIASSPKPVIALIDGMTYGAGIELALSCHFTIATERSSLVFPETSIGLFPYFGGTQRLPKIVGPELARYLILLGHKINASCALEFNLIDRLVKNKQELYAIINDISNSQNITIDYLKSNYKETKDLSTDISKTIKLLRNVDLLITNKLVSKRAKELSAELEQKPLNIINIANNLISLSSKLSIEEGMKREISFLKEVLQQDELESKLRTFSNA